MSEQDLRELLTQLHARLSGAGSLDAEGRKLLSTVLQDIERALARSDVSAAPPQPRLEALAVKFEADHPGLAKGLRELIELLRGAGI